MNCNDNSCSNSQVDKNYPLCVFRLSPSLSIQLLNRPPAILSPSRRLLSSKRRTGVCSKIQIKPGFKRKSRRFSHRIAKYLLGHVKCNNKDTLSFHEVLDTLKQVWISPNCHLKSYSNNNNKYEKMTEESSRYSNTSSEISSPIILRRRLSAPETIMRKHMLAQQRLDDSDGTQISESTSIHWRSDIGSSDQNLYKNRDIGIRRSTLLRRLWSNNKSLSEKRSRCGGHYDWQYSSVKVINSQSSAQSSPEHKKLIHRRPLNNEDSRTSPSTIRSNKVPSKYNFDESNIISPKKQIHKRIDLPNDQKSIGSSRYYTNFQTETDCEHLSTRSTDDNTSTTSYATYSDNYDSTYTYNTKMSNTTPSTCDTYENNNNNNNKLVQHKAIDASRKFNEAKTEKCGYSKCAAVNESTQTSDITNLNIISNVQLSQSTINSIFNHVLNDLQDDRIKNINEMKQDAASDDNGTKLIKVKEVPSFYLKPNVNAGYNDESQILKYMISNVGTGSNYGKPAEVPQLIVPRYSALPRTSSMEVNTSSGDGTDKESDTLSLVDSLEDPASPRVNEKLSNCDSKSIRDDISPLLLPDNSKKRKRLKPATFYVPIETDAETEIRPVAEHLPAKVKEKLWKRQVKREEKIAQTKSTFLTALNNHSLMVIMNDNNDNPTLRQYAEGGSGSRVKLKSKPILPSIDRSYKQKGSRDKIKIQPEENGKKHGSKSVKRKSVFASQGQLSDSYKYKVKPGSQLSLRMRHKPEKLTPISTTRNEFMHENVMKKTCNPSEVDNKRIEILEIVECIQTTALDNAQQIKNKSRIPVLVKPKNSKMQQQPQQQHGFIRPYYLDSDQAQVNDPKIDQLIANILIDSLNISQGENSRTDVMIQSKSQRIGESRSSETYAQVKHSQHTQHSKTKFDSIPEESSCHSHNSKSGSFEEINDNVERHEEKKVTDNENVKEEAAILKNGNSPSTVPKGWITFYMLQKHQGTPDSTSDEGTNKKENNENVSKAIKHEDVNKDHKTESSNCNNTSCHNHHRQQINHLKIKSQSSDYNVPDINVNHSDSDSMSSAELDQRHTSKYRNRKKSIQYRQNKQQHQLENSNNIKRNEWSVTVSSSNNYGQILPELEMRLKFPGGKQDNDNEQSDGNNSFKMDTKNGMPPLQNKPTTNVKGDSYSKRSTKLPEIKNIHSNKCGSSGIPMGIMLPSNNEPRQTRTSSRRYYLNRPYKQYTGTFESEAMMALREENRQLCEILKRLPTLLKVTGSAISPERKPKVTTMSERDLTRNIYMNHQQ